MKTISAIRTALLLCLLSVHSVPAQESTQWPVSVERVPEAFSKPLPTSVNDLRDMQSHLAALVPRLKECTVNLQIGPAQGSGVIVDPTGIIITAAHVAGPPGRTIRIITDDGKSYRGKTLGRNRSEWHEASAVQIVSNRTDWPYCEMAQERSTPGDWCVVLGHPGGYQPERGLVLRLGRIIFESRWRLQTDCELVGGDSGGPLFGMDGKVIGINTRIGEEINLNFHIPVAAYTSEWDRLVAGEDFQTHSGAYLGVIGEALNSGRGLTITQVLPGQPAELAGIRKGDILLTFESRRVTSLDQLREMIGNESSESTVTLTLLRDGELISMLVPLGLRRD